MEAGAAGQVEQQGLQIVVGVVGGGDAVTAQLRRRPAEKFVPELPPRLLHPQAPAFGLGVHLSPLHHAGDAPAGAPVGDEGGIGVGRLPPHAVVVVGGAHPEAPLLRPGVEQVEQAHGVRPAGHGAQHRAPPGQHVVFG